MDQVTQQNAAMVEEAAAAAREMEDRARSLNELVAFFDFSDANPTQLGIEQPAQARPALPTRPPHPIISARRHGAGKDGGLGSVLAAPRDRQPKAH